MEETRLQKYMAAAGIASRRACEKLIEGGKVTINGVVASLGDKVKEGDIVEYNGQPVGQQKETVTYMLYKPVGVVTTAKDEKGRKTVVDMVKSPFRLYPVGRLDLNTSGLLLLTNDGQLANGLTHPRFEVEKTYQAIINGNITPEAIGRLQSGVMLEDGMTMPAKAELIRYEGEDSLVRITIREGRNRQVRRMLEAVGHSVKNLRRTSVGKLTLGSLEKGQYRLLTKEELTYLYRLIGEKPRG